MRTALSALCLALLCSACETPTLPEGEIPQDFLFTFTWERNSEQAPVGEQVPRRIHLSVDVAGVVQYEIEHVLPAPASKTGEFRLEEATLNDFYEAVRTADLYTVSEVSGGTETTFGTRTFFVIGRNKPRTVVAKDTEVPALESLQAALFSLVPAETFAYPVEQRRTVIMDKRTLFFHRGDCAEAQKIPEESRRTFENPWAALDAGGRPAADCTPLKGWE